MATPQSYGYPGTATPEDAFAAWTGLLGRSYAARDFADWRVTAVSGGSTRQVQVSQGWIAGQGVADNISAATTVPQLGVLATDGSRYDLIVARRTWQTTKATTLAVVQGTASRALPARTSGPGTADDQPLALVKLQRTNGNYTIPEIVDLRLVGWEPGLVLIFDDLARQLAQRPGMRCYNVNTGVTSECVIDKTSGATTWVQRDYSLVDHLLYGVDTSAYTRLTTATAYGKGTQLTLRSNPNGSKPSSGDVFYVQLSDGNVVGATILGVDVGGRLTHVTVPVELLTDPTTYTAIGTSTDPKISGWSTNTSSSSSLYQWGPLKQLVLVTRTTKSTYAFNAKGGLTDTPVFLLGTDFRPRRAITVSFRYQATDGGQYGGTATIGSDGYIKLLSGSPNTTIKTATSSDWSVVVDGLYLDF